MKLLLDENLSPRLVALLGREFPGLRHVEQLGLRGRTDLEPWELAARDGCVLVSKDNDFRQLSFLRGHPPKVIWLDVADAGTDVVARRLASGRARIAEFVGDEFEILLVLDLRGGGLA